jgi:lipopolysaccharide export system permease protein
VFGGILQRMILWELIKVFLIALVGITGILLMAGILSEAAQQGLSPGQLLAAIPLLIPSMLPYTIPATTLFAACVVYGRLAADNEILAIKSAGVNILTVVRPGLLLGVAISAGTLGLYYEMIPYTHRLLRAMVFEDAEELIYSLLKRQGVINHPQLAYSMYVQGVRGKKLLSPVIKRKDAQGKIDVVATAQEAEVRVHMQKKLLIVHMKNGVTSAADGSRGYFVERDFDVPLPKDFGSEGPRRPRAMTWPEIRERQVEIGEEEEVLGSQVSIEMAQALLTLVPPDFPEHLARFNQRFGLKHLEALALDVELQMRVALSVGCLCFVLVGCPVGIWFSRSDYLSSFITCFMPIIVVYYPLLLCGTGMAKEGRLPPAPLVYAADALMGLAGLVLFRKLLKN